MKERRAPHPWLAVAAVLIACSSKPSIDIGHDLGAASGGDAGEDAGDLFHVDSGPPPASVVSTPISCPYGWVLSTASPLDVCCKANLVSTCAYIARGDRPFTCNTTPDGCGCAFGGGGHRYEARCNQASGCVCLADGLPNPVGVLPYVCNDGEQALDTLWRTTCGFPLPADTGSATPCPFGYTNEGNECCKGTGCQAPIADKPFGCAVDPRGCGCMLTSAPHYYEMKCAQDSCACAVNGYAQEIPVPAVCTSDQAKLVDLWNHSCGFPPQ